MRAPTIGTGLGLCAWLLLLAEVDPLLDNILFVQKEKILYFWNSIFLAEYIRKKENYLHLEEEHLPHPPEEEHLLLPEGSHLLLQEGEPLLLDAEDLPRLLEEDDLWKRRLSSPG